MTFDFENLIGRDQIALIYVAYYGRLPDPEGFRFWDDFYRVETGNGVSSQDAALKITDFFLDQDETRSNYPFFENPAIASVDDVSSFLDEVYLNLFNRPPDDAGREFWSGQIVNRLEADQGFSDLLTQIIDGAQADDIPIVDNKLEVANYYVTFVGEGFVLENAAQLAASVDGTDLSVERAFEEIDSQTIVNNVQTNGELAIEGMEVFEMASVVASLEFAPATVVDATEIDVPIVGSNTGATVTSTGSYDL